MSSTNQITVLIRDWECNMSEDEPMSLLVVVLDTNPVWWGKRLLKQDGDLLLSQFLNSAMVFVNSHLMLQHGNKLAVIAAHTDSSKFIYPRPPLAGTIDEDQGSMDGRYELFTHLDNTIQEEITHLILKETEGTVASDSLIAGAMAMAMCYIHRMEKEASMGQEISSRILVIKGSEDNPSQYMNFMNVVFTAQKQNVVIDACILDNESGLLQQACDISGGIYLKIPQMSGILQYLQWVFLPDPKLRAQLTLPPKAQVDYRAACFCHRNLIDIGYVCSVCLSIFCTFSPICSTCHTTFKILGPPKMMKKKTKKSAIT